MKTTFSFLTRIWSLSSREGKKYYEPKHAKIIKYICLNTIDNTLFIGKVFQHYEKLDSTNEKANEYLSKNNPSEGTVISTYHQEKGRGQIGSLWESEPDKNISLSIILYPHFVPLVQQFSFNQAIALGVYDFIASNINKEVKVKWPNDVYVGLKKIAGILIQNSLAQGHIQSSIVGLGININQRDFLSDAPNPTSFLLETGQEQVLDHLVGQLCHYIERRYLQLRSRQVDLIRQDYLNNLFRFMEDTLYRDRSGRMFSGRIVGVSPQGQLRIDGKEGEKAFGMKEVQFIL